MAASDNRIQIPGSVTSFRINLLALLCFLAGLYGINVFNGSTIEPNHARLIIYKMCFLLLCWSVPVVVLELFYFKRLRNFDRNRLSLRRALIKTVGLYLTLTLCGLVYWIFPEYHGSFYNPYWEVLKLIGPFVLTASLPYFYLADGYIKNPKDGYHEMGCLALRINKTPEAEVFKQHLLGWLVKLFFLPLMTVYLYNTTRYFSGLDTAQLFTNFTRFYDFAWELVFAVDLVIVTAGYILTLKLLDSHIRTSEPTVGGWLVAIICYEPFWSAVSVGYLAYNKDSYNWGNWLAGNDLATMIWGSMILLLISIYSLSSVAFGIRFSNLTHRGIITNGPYRYTKHPAYLSKNLSWWLIAIPFISTSGNITTILQSCLMLMTLNMVYYLRAKTEERHLAWDETYCQYQLAIAQHGIIGRMHRMLAGLVYTSTGRKKKVLPVRSNRRKN